MPELRSGIFFFGLALFVLWESLRLELGTLKTPGPGFLSFGAGIGLAVLSLALITSGWGKRADLKAHSRRVILALLALFAYSLILDTLGFIVATFLLVAILFRLGGYFRQWWTLVAASASVALLAYLFFGILLNVFLPRGLFSF